MKKKILSFVLNFMLISTILFSGAIWADTNGVWTLAQDIRGGIFGSDEQPISNFTFINPVYFYNKLLSVNNSYFIDIGNRTQLNDLVSNKFSSNSANINGSLIVTGNVGIGTQNPQAKLDVNGNISAQSIYSNGQLVATQNYVLDHLSSSSQAIGSSGMYNNVIPSGSFPKAYTEICFKDGTTKYDLHTAGQSTAGGNCLPGDRGFVIEQDLYKQNTYIKTVSWVKAKQTCLEIGMRLPEPFEFMVSAKNSFFRLKNTGESEWVSNTVTPVMAITSVDYPSYENIVPTMSYSYNGGNHYYTSYSQITESSTTSKYIYPGINYFRCVK